MQTTTEVVPRDVRTDAQLRLPIPLRLAGLAGARGLAHGRDDHNFHLRVAPPLRGAAQRVVVGPGLLQPVVLGAHAGRRQADGPPDLGVCPGRAVGLEDELPGADPVRPGAVPPALPRPADLDRAPEHRVLVGDPRGLRPGALGVAVGRRGALGRGAGAADAAVLAARVERLPRAATGRSFRPLGRARCARAIRPVGRAGDRRDARLPAGIRRRRDDIRHPAPAAAEDRWARPSAGGAPRCWSD